MTKAIRFIDPIDGVMVSNAAGKLHNDSLKIEVSLDAYPGRHISVNGVHTIYRNGAYRATVSLNSYKNTLEAVDTETGAKETIRVYWLKNADKKYRLMLDDNIWCLQDIARNADSYKSIFENPYLGFFKDVHDQFGTKVHMHIYYQCPEFGGFNLSQMPDKYRDEWQTNSDWLRLTFHADQNLPDRPYVNVGYDQMKYEHERVISEIKRFAGEEVLSPVTTIHWAEVTKEGCHALKEQGVCVLTDHGFRLLDDGTFGETEEDYIVYYLSDEQVQTALTYGFYKDHSEDIIFCPDAIVLNSYTPQEIRKLLDASLDNYPKKSYVGLLIHEQYFYPHYVNYLPDYKERVLAGVEWCIKHNYESSFVKDFVFE